MLTVHEVKDDVANRDADGYRCDEAEQDERNVAHRFLPQINPPMSPPKTPVSTLTPNQSKSLMLVPSGHVFCHGTRDRR